MRIEHWWFTAPLRLKSILRGRRAERELDEELQFHLDHKTEAGIASGLSPREAREAALRAMGGLEQRKEEMRDMRRVHWLTDFVDDASYAIRNLHRTFGLTAFVVITLGLGIGMSAAVFSMLDGLIFRPYPVLHPGRVVTLIGTSREKSIDDFSYREYVDIRGGTTSYDGVIASGRLQGVGFGAGAGATPQVRAGMLVSGNYFRVLGVEPQLGRGFRDDEDDVAGRDAVVVLGPDFWKHEFAGDPSVVGRIVRLNGADFTVIGVAPDTFTGMQLFQRPDVYVPLAMARRFSTALQKDFFENRDDRELTVMARLHAGTSVPQARGELAVLAQRFEREYPALNRDRGSSVLTQFEIRTRADAGEWKFISIFAVLALAVLLVACTNVAGLLLSRAQTRTREIAVRLALGAGRFRLIRMLLTESLILAVLGGLAGVAVAYGAITFFLTLAIPAELPATLPFQLDHRVLLANLALSVLSAIACGLAPALQSTRTDLVNGLKSSDGDAAAGISRTQLWGRNVLVVAQVAMSLLLLTASFLVTRGFHNSVAPVTGFAKDHLLLARFDPRLVQYDRAQTQQFYKLLAARARATPGVRSAGLTLNPPLGLGAFDHLAFVPDGFQLPRDRENFKTLMDSVDEGFFTTMGVAILRGRGVKASDTADAPRVAVVNEQFARHYWPNADAVGQHFRLDSPTGTPVEVVGVAQTITYRQTFERPIDFVYLPMAQHPDARMVLLLRSNGDPRHLIEPLKDIVRALDANLPISETRTYEDVYRYQAVQGPGVGILLVTVMGLVGLTLAISGLYGLVAYNVSRRTREIGIRMAIGAGPADVLRLVMGKGLVLVVTGTAIGLVLGLALERVMNAVLFNAGGVDILAYIVIVPSLLLATLLATYVPARRASRIAPTQALRYE
jgi:predicted permease